MHMKALDLCIMESELRIYKTVGKRDVLTYIVWAAKLAEWAVNNGVPVHLVKFACKRAPIVLSFKLGSDITDWNALVTKAKDITVSELRDKLRHGKADCWVKTLAAKAIAKARSLLLVPDSPTAGIHCWLVQL